MFLFFPLCFALDFINFYYAMYLFIYYLNIHYFIIIIFILLCIL